MLAYLIDKILLFFGIDLFEDEEKKGPSISLFGFNSEYHLVAKVDMFPEPWDDVTIAIRGCEIDDLTVGKAKLYFDESKHIDVRNMDWARNRGSAQLEADIFLDDLNLSEMLQGLHTPLHNA